MIATYVGENKEFERQFLTGELEVELVPQGTFAERIRAGGAGIGGFFTPTGYGTIVAEGKETRDHRRQALRARAAAAAPTSRSSRRGRATALGNLVYRQTARNFNPVMATAAAVTIAEVEQLVEPGEHRPGPRRHAGHLRAAHPPGRALREADREADDRERVRSRSE